MMACLERCDAQTLRELKAVSKGWQQRARRALWERLLDMCSRQSPRPLSLHDVEELDVEELPHEAVAAVRSVPNLARLRGYGFRVELKGPQGVRQALPYGLRYGLRYRLALGGADPSAPCGSAAYLRCALIGGSPWCNPLGGAALRSCIHEGEGEPPHELLLAAVACAARGTVRRVPVQQLREDDAIGSLDLANKGLGVSGAELLGLMLPAATSLRELR